MINMNINVSYYENSIRDDYAERDPSCRYIRVSSFSPSSASICLISSYSSGSLFSIMISICLISSYSSGSLFSIMISICLINSYSSGSLFSIMISWGGEHSRLCMIPFLTPFFLSFFFFLIAFSLSILILASASVYSYKAFDEVNGIEVAWNQVDIDLVLHSPHLLERLYSELHLLKSLKHVNIIKCYHSWVDHHSKTINMITELFTSGNLRQYRKKHKSVDMKAIKNWARQILRGLQYLHAHNPCIIHRDLKCENVFINGNTGEVKIGDLGLAFVMQQPTARSVIGTPEFMAPELYDEEYNELVDIYSFGMCLLEMVTCEYPYSECKNPAQIYKKVSSGVKPIALSRVTDPQVKEFIERCLLPASLRPSAGGLLKDPFLASSCSAEPNPLLVMPRVPESVLLPKPDVLSMDMDLDANNSRSSCMGSNCGVGSPSTVELVMFSGVNTFNVTGELEDDKSISMSLRIVDIDGNDKNIHFTFYLKSDTTISIVREMVEEKCLAFSDKDVDLIAQLMDDLIGKLVPNQRTNYNCDNLEAKRSHDEQSYPLNNASGCEGNPDMGREDQGLESLTSGISTECSLVNHSLDPHSSVGDCSMFSNSPLDGLSLSSMSSQDNYKELKQELDAINLQYHQCFHELVRRREEAIEDAKKRWLNRKLSVASLVAPFQ